MRLIEKLELYFKLKIILFAKNFLKMTFPTFKVIIIGDTSTGKTSIINRYAKQIFSEAHFVTPVPVEHMQKVNGNCNLDIWDTAGAEEWQSMNKSVYHGTHAIIYLCSYDNQESLTNLKEVWLPRVSEHISTDNVLSFLAVNKSDLPEDFKNITEENIDQMKGEIKALKCFIVSAKNNTNINELFSEVATRLVEKAPKNNQNPVSLNDQQIQDGDQKSGCC